MSNEAPSFKVEESQRQRWVSLAAVWSGSLVCIPALMVGGYLSLGFPVPGIILSIILGYGIICVYMCLLGMQGSDTGLPTVSMASNALGKKGAQYLISALIAISLVGWFGVQAAVCGASFSGMMSGIAGINIPVPVSSIGWGILMVLTAMFGYNSLKWLNYIAVPALILVLGYALYAAVFQNDGWATVTAYRPEQPMTLVAGINLAVATFAVGGVISADYSRYAKNRADVIKSNLIGVLPTALIVMFIGAACSIVAGEYDITSILTKLGLPAFGLIALILATWTTNVTNAYSGGIAVSNMLGLGEGKFKITTGIAGGLGIILGALGIIDHFTEFLNILTSFIPPVAGVIIAAYWIIGKGKKENFAPTPGINVVGIVSFILGAAVAYITANITPFFVAPVNGIIISMIAYVVLIKVVPAKIAFPAVATEGAK